MNRSHSILQNSLFNFIKSFAGVAFPLITFTYAARILGENGVGRVTFTKSFVTYYSMLAMLGMNIYGTRETARLRESRLKLSKFVHEMLIINGFTTILAYTLLALSVLLIPQLKGYELLIVINSCAILLQGMGMEWLYQGLEEYRYISIRSILFQFFALALMFAFVHNSNDVVAYAVVSTMASYGSYAMNFINARKYIDFKRHRKYEIRKHIKPLLWLFALAVSIELYTVLDSTMLGFIKGDASVGRYTAAVKVNKLVNTLITSVGVVLIPRISFHVNLGEDKKVRDLLTKAYHYIFIFSIPAAIGLFMLSNEIILLFSGKAFTSASLTMRLLTPIVMIIPFSVTTNQQTLIPMGKEKLVLISTCLGAITNLICNAVLIPRYAENGAAIATVLAETVVAFVSYHNASRFFDMRRFFKCYYQYWLAALPIPLIALLFRHMVQNSILRIIITVVVSASIYFLSLIKQRNEYVIQICQRMLGKLKRRERSS